MNAENQKQLLPDWEKCKSVFFVWPEHLDAGVGSLMKKDYLNLIHKIIRHSGKKIKLLTTLEPSHLREKYDFIKRIEIIQAPVNDVWIRDYAPLQLKENGKICLVKPSYNPFYLQNKEDRKYAEAGNKLSEFFGALTNKSLTNVYGNFSEFKLDGGNIITNGKGLGISTNRVIAENETMLIRDIKETFRRDMGITKLLIVPTEPNDFTGHIDGMVRFLDSQTVAVGQYSWEELERNSVYDKIAHYLQEEGLTVVRIENGNPDNTNKESAKGNYLNFLRIENKIYLQRYKGQEDLYQKAAEVYSKFVSEVIPIDCEGIYEKGGVLNCISWQDYRIPIDLSAIPSNTDSWNKISNYALTFNGYDYRDDVASIANGIRKDFSEKGAIFLQPITLDDLRACLFFEQRRFYHYGWGPDETEMIYIRELITEIQKKAIAEEKN
jgi:agmatine deiminase